MEIAVKQKIVVLYASEYRVERDDKEGGGFAEGVTLSYLYGDNIQPTLNPNGSMGQRPAKGSVHLTKWPHFVSVPGLYEGDFGMTVDSKGKPTLVLQDVNFLGLVNLAPAEYGEKPPMTAEAVDKPKAAAKKEA